MRDPKSPKVRPNEAHLVHAAIAAQERKRARVLKDIEEEIARLRGMLP